MAKYYVTFSCGHEGEVHLVGPMKERERKIEWFEREGLCPDCWKEEVEKKRRAESEAAAQAAQEMGLPELKGTQKQIAWAEKLRKEQFEHIDRLIEIISRKEGEKARKYEEWLRKMREKLAGIDEAKFWIDHRFHSIDNLWRYVGMKSRDEYISNPS